ncbi:WD repeat and SOF domain-containing protein 1 [Kwoniella heveanensis BCC8398]|uniref:WD repeat and SOF domain-containing protein 1 n=1 Tax=Kwoniella heveanensis BCC8398 TaxID=1296120 RepID=A0A1B9GRE0_9TREE|nr:WD repeat and SOF domain-containing protein 1 [Kwoniella heveanensis BCC8398]
MSLFGQVKRHAPSSKPRRSPLPTSAWDTEKKYDLSSPSTSPSGGGSYSRLFTAVYVPLPRIPFGSSSDTLLNSSNGLSSPHRTYGHHHPHGHARSRYVKIYLPIPPRLYARLPRLNSPVRIVLFLVILLVTGLFLLGFRKKRGGGSTWSPPFVDPDTKVITSDESASIWEWEILSGHYPSTHPPPDHLPLAALHNPVVPASLLPSPSSPTPLVAYQNRNSAQPKIHIFGEGPERNYLSAWDTREGQPGYAPRPMPGAILDLDLVLEKCDFGNNKYVRDCLEFLRIGGGLDNGRRVRRGNYLSQYKQLYFESTTPETRHDWTPRALSTRAPGLSRTPLDLSSPYPVSASFDSRAACDPLHPRIFHMFWAGPFTDKPYMAVMSFLFTQNLGLDKPVDISSSDDVRGTCRPQFWVWINPGPAAAVPNPNAKREMYESLATNPWSAPFLHERFREVVKFKMWNTTEQLDGIDELKDHWRAMPIFNSGGNTYKQPAPQQTPIARVEETILEERTEGNEDEPKMGDILAEAESTTEAPATKKGKGGIFEKVGSSSESDYDRLSVILSDMARFVLTYRFGGIYLDADTLFLRDWEELWNYRGQFAYRWSWHQKYNTAVLKLHKRSALATFLFKTALENGLDFHPMTVSRYLKDAGLDKLLFRVPDALFDPAWLNMERYQRERPPFPYFPEFSVFFSNDKFDAAGPQPLGFDGFFRGAFSYHFHNFWWLPFDSSRNWPDLGERFIKGEKALKDAAKASSLEGQAHLVGDVPSHEHLDDEMGITKAEGDGAVSSREDMDDELDLSWSTVLKRTFEAYLRAERPNAYGEWLEWGE